MKNDFFEPMDMQKSRFEVYAAKPTEWIDDLVTYRIKFELMANKEMGVFLKLTSAFLNTNFWRPNKKNICESTD